MNSETERGRGNSAVEGFIAEKTCGDSAEKAGGLHSLQVPGDESGGDVHASTEQAGPEDRGQSAGILAGIDCGCWVHVLNFRFVDVQIRLSRLGSEISGTNRD